MKKIIHHHDGVTAEFTGYERILPQQKPVSDVCSPLDRPFDWITHGTDVAFVIKDKGGKIRIRIGFICSSPGSHGHEFEVDNIKKTVVYSYQVLNEMADDADDAHEQSFNPKDPCLLRLDEIEILKEPDYAVTWFKNIYSPEIARQISALLSKSDLGLEDEGKEKAQEYLKHSNKMNAVRQHWIDHGGPISHDDLDKIS